jgi:hypothetical protein
MSTFSSARSQLTDALASTFTRVESSGLTWNCIGLPEMDGIRFTVALEDARWIVVAADAPRAKIATNGTGAATNGHAHIGGRARAAGDAAVTRESRRAEFPYDPDLDAVARLAATATAVARASGMRVEARPANAPARPDAWFSQALVDVCSEAGWPYHRRPDGAIVADLDVPGDFRQADLSLDHSGFRATLNFQFADPVSESSRRALALMVALMNGSLRLVNVHFADSQGQTAVRAEVGYAFVPAATEVGEALAALSVAARCWAAELDLLGQEEAFARTYLVARESRDNQTQEED